MSTPTTGDMISDDLLTEILVRLPVKSLLRCKSVCKPWLSLISNPNFTKSQLKHSQSKPGADQTLIVEAEDEYSWSLLHLDSPQTRTPLGHPFSRGDFSFDPQFDIVASCNGLVCVAVDPINDNPYIYLWNPATKQSKLIPPHNLLGEIMSVALGFGFDPVADDYKVVRIVSFLSADPRAAEVYSANTNVWQKVKPDLSEGGKHYYNVPGDFPEEDEFDVSVNGFLCCLGYYGMMAFNLNTEVFTIGLKLPLTKCLDACFGDFNGTIAVITSQKSELNYTFSLWTLDDEACLHGGKVEASWTLMLSIDVDYPYPRVYGCFNSGDFVLYTQDDNCLLYNPHTKEARNAPVSISIRGRIIKYNESLVSVTGSKQVDWNAHEDNLGDQH